MDYLVPPQPGHLNLCCCESHSDQGPKGAQPCSHETLHTVLAYILRKTLTLPSVSQGPSELLGYLSVYGCAYLYRLFLYIPLLWRFHEMTTTLHIKKPACYEVLHRMLNLVGTCEHSNEPSGCTKSRQFFHYLSITLLTYQGLCSTDLCQLMIVGLMVPSNVLIKESNWHSSILLQKHTSDTAIFYLKDIRKWILVSNPTVTESDIAPYTLVEGDCAMMRGSMHF